MSRACVGCRRWRDRSRRGRRRRPRPSGLAGGRPPAYDGANFATHMTAVAAWLVCTVTLSPAAMTTEWPVSEQLEFAVPAVVQVMPEATPLTRSVTVEALLPLLSCW